jgi:hypothetical protein
MTTKGVENPVANRRGGNQPIDGSIVDKATKNYVSVSCETFVGRDHSSTG